LCGKCVALGELENGLYWLKTFNQQNSPTTNQVNKNNIKDINIWHQRLGHIGIKTIENAVKNQLAKDIEISNFKIIENCSGCNEGKMVQKPSKAKKSRKQYNFSGLIHWDICGPTEMPSLGGNRHLLILVDDVSTIAKGYCLHNKSESGKRVMEYVNEVENHFNAKVLCVRHDGAKEFATNILKNFLSIMGIQQQVTVRYAHATNGTAERMIRTAVTMARCMLHHANLDKSFWAEACQTAIYIRNRMPTARL